MSFKIGVDFTLNTGLGRRERKRQAVEQSLHQICRVRAQRLCALRPAPGPGRRQSELLGQELIELYAAPGRVLVFDKLRIRNVGGGMMQKGYGLLKRNQVVPFPNRQRQCVGQIGLLQCIVDKPSEHGLGKRSEEHTSELQSLMRISYAVFCLKK